MKDDGTILFLTDEELITLGMLAIEGFERMMSEHVISSRYDTGRMVKVGALVHRLETECNERSAEALTRLTAGESDAR